MGADTSQRPEDSGSRSATGNDHNTAGESCNSRQTTGDESWNASDARTVDAGNSTTGNADSSTCHTSTGHTDTDTGNSESERNVIKQL